MIPSRRAWIFRGWSSRTRRCGGRWTTPDTGRYNSGHMNAGTKFAIGAVLIVGSVGYLMASGVKQTGQYFLTPTELTQKIAVDPSFYDVGMKVGARVVPGTVSKDVATQTLRFQVADGSARYPVVFPRLPPAARRLRDVRRTARRRRLARVGAVPARLQRRVCRRVHQP